MTLSADPPVAPLDAKIVFTPFKYRIYPTKLQANFLEGQLREACELYNCALEERKGAWSLCRKTISYYDQAGQIPAMRADGCLQIVNSSCCQDVLRRLDKAFKDFFRRVKRGGNPGFPRFRSRHRYDSITFPSYQKYDGCHLMPNGKLRVQGAGHIKIKLHRPVEGKIKTVTIKRQADQWFACFITESKLNPLPVSAEEIGIDVGIISLATLSDGSKIENRRFRKRSQDKIRRCQRKADRCKKGSNRRRKAMARLRNAHAKIRRQRADFQHKESRKIVNRFGLIAVEDFNMNGIIRGILSKSLHDVAFSQFLKFIRYKAEWAGREFIEVDRRGTSQTCICGEFVPKKMSDRWHSCPRCGLAADRDHVSAQVILQRARNLPSGANVEVVNSSVSRESVNVTERSLSCA